VPTLPAVRYLHASKQRNRAVKFVGWAQGLCAHANAPQKELTEFYSAHAWAQKPCPPYPPFATRMQVASATAPLNS
jgi:hypothetical protein